jgi:hypothetical protein
MPWAHSLDGSLSFHPALSLSLISYTLGNVIKTSALYSVAEVVHARSHRRWRPPGTLVV